MDTTVRASLLFLSFVTATACLYVTRDLLTPLALAVFIWLIIDAFARWLDNLSRFIPYPLALTIAILTVVAAMVGIGVIIADTVTDVARDAPRYAARFKVIFAWIGEHFSWVSKYTDQSDLSYTSLYDRFGVGEKIQGFFAGFAATVQGVLGNFFVIALYVAFLFAAQSSFPKKMDDLFPDMHQRATAQKVAQRIRHSIEKYLGVQTVISLIQTVLSYIIMVSMGLDNALFWALVIFILNYIPIVGGLAAFAMPALFSIVQFDSTGKVMLLAGLLFGAQTLIGNTLQPKMMGDSMNLSALVVVLSITLWGALWGGVGAFLSAPLTVIIMIILAQFPTTRWIAVLLSSDGQPDMDEMEKKQAAAIPSM